MSLGTDPLEEASGPRLRRNPGMGGTWGDTLRRVALGEVWPSAWPMVDVRFSGLLAAGIRIGSAYVASSCGNSFGSCVKLQQQQQHH